MFFRKHTNLFWGRLLVDNLTRDRVKMRFLRFFEGKTYPAIVSALAIFSSIFAVEIFLLPTLAALFFLASIFSRTARPLIITFIAAPLYISAGHSPSHTVSTVYGAGESDYLFTGRRFLILTLSAILIILGALFFFFKNKCYKRISLSRDKILAPALLLSVSFLLGGLLCQQSVALVGGMHAVTADVLLGIGDDK